MVIIFKFIKDATHFILSVMVSQKVTKRLDKLERKVALNNAEWKHRKFQTNEILTAGNYIAQNVNAITQGSSVANRTGDRIKIRKVDFSVVVQGNYVDLYFLKPLAGDNIPVQSQLSTYPGATFDPDQFHTYRHHVTTQEQRYIKWTVNFPNGLVSVFNQGTQFLEKGSLYFVIHNQSGNDVEVTGQVRVWYTDA